MAKKKITLGGQAVIEGVMIKSPNYVTIAVRNKDGIKTKVEKTKNRKAGKIFFIRGIVNLYDMLVYGTKAIIWSGEEIDGLDKKLSKSEIFFTLILSFSLAIGLFVVLPYFLTTLIGVKEANKPIIFNLLDGIIRIALFVAYIYLISLIKDVRVLFQYHGAEHKAIHCYEADKKLDVENVKPFSTIHPRCGTSFIMIVLFISIVVFSLVPALVKLFVPNLFEIGILKQKLILFLPRLLFIPIIAGISYEILRLNKAYSKNPLMKIINLPGQMLQKITTSEPDEAQIEVALKSLEKALESERS